MRTKTRLVTLHSASSVFNAEIPIIFGTVCDPCQHVLVRLQPERITKFMKTHYFDLHHWNSFIPSSLYAFLPPFIHSFLPSFIPSSLPSTSHFFLPSYLISFLPPLMHSFLPSCFYSPFIHSFFPSCITIPFVHSFFPSFILPPFIHSPFIQVLIYLSDHLRLPDPAHRWTDVGNGRSLRGINSSDDLQSRKPFLESINFGKQFENFSIHYIIQIYFLLI